MLDAAHIYANAASIRRGCNGRDSTSARTGYSAPAGNGSPNGTGAL